MLLILLMLALLVLTVICWKKSSLYNGWGLLGFFFGTGTVGLFIVVCCATGVVLYYQAGLGQCKRNLVIAQNQYDNQIEVIRAMIVDYPLEESLLRDLKPEILLNLPEIKSNILLIEQTKLALSYKDKIYNVQYAESALKRCLDFHKRRWFSPTLASPDYKP